MGGILKFRNWIGKRSMTSEEFKKFYDHLITNIGIEDLLLPIKDTGASVTIYPCWETQTLMVTILSFGGSSKEVTDEIDNTISQIRGQGIPVKITDRFKIDPQICVLDIGEGNGKERKPPKESGRHNAFRVNKK